MNPWRQYPLLRILIPFLAGLITAIHIDVDITFLLLPVILLFSLIYFIRDIYEALAALKLELQSNQALPPRPTRK